MRFIEVYSSICKNNNNEASLKLFEAKHVLEICIFLLDVCHEYKGGDALKCERSGGTVTLTELLSVKAVTCPARCTDPSVYKLRR
jgi:hypothetical protein